MALVVTVRMRVLVLPVRVLLAHLVLHIQMMRVMEDAMMLMMSHHIFQMQLVAPLMLSLSLLDLLW